MGDTCMVCRGAIPGCVQADGHTALCAEVIRADRAEAIKEAWCIIANAYDGDWNKASTEWRQAAERWRNKRVGFAPQKAAAPT